MSNQRTAADILKDLAAEGLWTEKPVPAHLLPQEATSTNQDKTDPLTPVESGGVPYTRLPRTMRDQSMILRGN